MTIVTLFSLHSKMLPLYLTKLHLQQCHEMACNITADTDILSVASRYFEMPALTKIITLVYILKFLFFFCFTLLSFGLQCSSLAQSPVRAWHISIPELHLKPL